MYHFYLEEVFSTASTQNVVATFMRICVFVYYIEVGNRLLEAESRLQITAFQSTAVIK